MEIFQPLTTGRKWWEENTEIRKETIMGIKNPLLKLLKKAFHFCGCGLLCSNDCGDPWCDSGGTWGSIEYFDTFLFLCSPKNDSLKTSSSNSFEELPRDSVGVAAGGCSNCYPKSLDHPCRKKPHLQMIEIYRFVVSNFFQNDQPLTGAQRTQVLSTKCDFAGHFLLLSLVVSPCLVIAAFALPVYDKYPCVVPGILWTAIGKFQADSLRRQRCLIDLSAYRWTKTTLQQHWWTCYNSQWWSCTKRVLYLHGNHPSNYQGDPWSRFWSQLRHEMVGSKTDSLDMLGKTWSLKVEVGINLGFYMVFTILHMEFTHLSSFDWLPWADFFSNGQSGKPILVGNLPGKCRGAGNTVALERETSMMLPCSHRVLTMILIYYTPWN